jgi:hypothetical protein
MTSIDSGCLDHLQDLIGASSESEDEIVALDWICACCDHDNHDSHNFEGEHTDIE